MDVLESTTNPFGGIVPVPGALPDHPEVFRQQLLPSLAAWREDGFLAVWLEIPISKAALVPIAVDAGFTYHHAAEDYLLLSLRLSDGVELPHYASHYIGAGGVVLNDRHELLVVREKRGRPRPKPHYKLPGGALHPGEHLADGAVREVLEETGIRTKFEALICFRNQHGYRYGKSDIYFVCRLSPLSHEISLQPEEIEECLWMPVQEYLSADTVSPFNKRIVEAAQGSPGLRNASIDGYGDPSKYEFFMPAQTGALEG